MKIVIVGGVAGGATAAARLRRLDETAQIVLLERSGYISYANCGLPYYIGEVIEDKQELTLQTPQSFFNRFRIDVRTHSEVVEVRPKEKIVMVRRIEDGTEYAESYDKLILAPGAKAILPHLPGSDSSKIMTLRTVEDTFRIKEMSDLAKTKRVVVVGGGFIGLEVAENLIGRGFRTTVIQRGEHVLPTIDYDLACQVHAYLRTNGMDLRLNTSVTGFEETEDGIRVITDKGPVEADFVVMAVGVAPESTLAKNAGLALGQKDSILVNEHMQTSDPDIYAVGDAVQVRHVVTGAPALIALAGPANKQARIAADHICGKNSVFTGSQGTSVLKLFEMTVASTGLNEQSANHAGVLYDMVITYSANHASYYPGSTNMTIKTLFDPLTGKILGAQAVGFEGVDKRIDVLATAIRAGMTDQDLTELDLAYAPPYASAKDPVNMVGYVISNVRKGLVRQYQWSDIQALSARDDVVFLDVRTKKEFEQGYFSGAINIPLDQLRENLSQLDPAKKLYVNCFSGLRSYLACRILSQNGFDCYHLAGGYHFYSYIESDIRFETDPTYPCGIKKGQNA